MNEKQMAMIARYVDDHPRAVTERILDDKTTLPQLRAWLIEQAGVSIQRRAAVRLQELKDAGYISDDTRVADLLTTRQRD